MKEQILALSIYVAIQSLIPSAHDDSIRYFKQFYPNMSTDAAIKADSAYFVRHLPNDYKYAKYHWYQHKAIVKHYREIEHLNTKK